MHSSFGITKQTQFVFPILVKKIASVVAVAASLPASAKGLTYPRRDSRRGKETAQIYARGKNGDPLPGVGSRGSCSRTRPLSHEPYFHRRFTTFLLQDSDSDRSFPRELSAGNLETVCVGNGNAACRAVGWLYQHCSWTSPSGALRPVPSCSYLPSGPSEGQTWQLQASLWRSGSPLHPTAWHWHRWPSCLDGDMGPQHSLAAWPSNTRAVPCWTGDCTYCRGSLRRVFPVPAWYPFWHPSRWDTRL